ncbi:hypothetical protein Q3G72_022555 [Acer saccharum]|nr:hypothetical protein Q3G72_022555 [Acer saccharum]
MTCARENDVVAIALLVIRASYSIVDEICREKERGSKAIRHDGKARPRTRCPSQKPSPNKGHKVNLEKGSLGRRESLARGSGQPSSPSGTSRLPKSGLGKSLMSSGSKKKLTPGIKGQQSHSNWESVTQSHNPNPSRLSAAFNQG